MTDLKEKKWQDHPVIIAIASGAAALIFAKTVIFPTITASLQNELSSLRSQVQEIADLKDRLKKIQEDAKDEQQRMEAEVKAEKDKLLAAQATNLFSLGSPYPVGFGKVKLGDGISAITSTYPETSIVRTSPNFWSVKHDHPAFRQLTYFFDRPTNLKERRIIGILVFGQTSISGILQDKLIESLGQPSSPGPKPDCYIWTIDRALFVKKDDPTSFSIQGTAPDCKIPER